MARGWESKSVELQQADRQSSHSMGPRVAPEDRARLERRQAALLALARVRDELAKARQPAHRAMLERAAVALEAEISDAS